MKTSLSIALGALGFCLAGAACRPAQPAARLAAEAEEPSTAVVAWSAGSVQPGGVVELGIRVELAEGWHTYADPPGDSGMAPMVRVTGEGVEAGRLQLPPHAEFRDPAGVTFGFERCVLMRLPVRAAAEAKPGTRLPVTVRLDYLVCRDVCLPGRQAWDLELPVTSTDPRPWAEWARWLREGGWDDGREK